MRRKPGYQREKEFRELLDKLEKEPSLARLLLATVPIPDYMLIVLWGLVRIPLRPARVRKMPGVSIMRLVRFFVSSKSLEQVYEPLYADFQYEYFSALIAGQAWRARWIRMRFYGTFLKTVGAFNIAKLGRQMYELWKAAS